jgi:hypothetical protein
MMAPAQQWSSPPRHLRLARGSHVRSPWQRLFLALARLALNQTSGLGPQSGESGYGSSRPNLFMDSGRVQFWLG